MDREKVHTQPRHSQVVSSVIFATPVCRENAKISFFSDKILLNFSAFVFRKLL